MSIQQSIQQYNTIQESTALHGYQGRTRTACCQRVTANNTVTGYHLSGLFQRTIDYYRGLIRGKETAAPIFKRVIST